MNKSKKIISVVAAATLALSTFAFVGCGSSAYKGETLTKDTSAVDLSTNGGFVVETGDFVYFINGVEAYTADNAYGTPVKGSLMRIAKTELALGNFSAAQLVIPSLFVASDYTAGIYIYGDKVYYATPTTDKNNVGQIENSYLDFKWSKLDGSEAPMGGKNNHFLRLSSNSSVYRFVEQDEKLYCLYEEGTTLKSYNITDDKTTVLVTDAEDFFYADNSADVYYTKKVTYDLDKTTSSAENYNQIYIVNAAASATVSVDDTYAAYTANSKGVETTYKFDKKFMKDNAEKKGYDLNDYTTYPYVNLGQLVLDGVGSRTSPSNDTRYNVDKEDIANAGEPGGYKYAIRQQANGGIYFTRDAVEKTDSEITKLYYLANDKGENWNTITGNETLQIVSNDTATASATALYEYENGVHSYIYHDSANQKLKRRISDANGKEKETIELAVKVATANLLKTDGNYLYYYGTGTNGNSLTRINYKGEQSDYNHLVIKEGDDYYPLTVSLLDWSDSWYKPEFVSVGETQFVFYPNAQSFGSGGTAYNYIYAAKLGSNADIHARNEEIKAVNEYIDEYSEDSKLQALMKYYFRTGEQTAYETIINSEEENQEKYTDDQQKEFTKFVEKFKEGGDFAGRFESKYIAQVGQLTKADKEAIADAWTNSLIPLYEEEETGGLEAWAIALIVVGGVLVVGAAVAIPTIIALRKKKAKKQSEEAIVSAYKRKKIDTTDDKTIDVYADEDAKEETPVETPVAEEPVSEETVEEEQTETEEKIEIE